jgi:hypothetical protein
VQVLAGPGERLAVGLAMIEEMPLEGFEDSSCDEAWREDVAVEAPQGEGSYVDGSLADSGEGEVVGGQPGEVGFEQQVEALRVGGVAEGFYMVGGIGIGHDAENLFERNGLEVSVRNGGTDGKRTVRERRCSPVGLSQGKRD